MFEASSVHCCDHLENWTTGFVKFLHSSDIIIAEIWVIQPGLELRLIMIYKDVSLSHQAFWSQVGGFIELDQFVNSLKSI